MSDQQQREKLEAIAAENNKLRPMVAKLERDLELVTTERDAYMRKLNVGTKDSPAFEALRESLAEKVAALSVAEKRIRSLEADVERLSAGAVDAANGGG